LSKNTDTFYRDLEAFTEFPDVTVAARYAPLPSGWFVVVADIVGSTKAIEGRYKDVNLMGAACITAVINALPNHTIPYVFGGDGATMTIPASAANEVRRVLGLARRLSRDQFDLDLRAGMVPVDDVREAGADVRIAKFQLTPGNYLATFSGGGVQLVDSMIKADARHGAYDIAIPTGDGSPDLEGLSCRWEPLASCRGTMMSMLILAIHDDDTEKAKTYNTVIDGVAEILLDEANSNNPVSSENMVFKWPSRGIERESKLLRGCGKPIKDLVWLYLQSFTQYVLERLNLSAGGYNAPVYRDELRRNSDFRRFDDMLRMILDCPLDKADEIESFFVSLHEKGRIVFGTHRSDHALMTCLVFSLTKSEHVHFVDGTEGGFAMAAVPLKARMKALNAGNID